MENKRNYGIDALRIIAMIFVIVLHSVNNGGLIANTIVHTSQYRLARIMNICAFCAVDIFALITGYVTYSDKEKPTKYSRYLELWFQVVFYGLLITLVFNIINPDLVSYKDYIISLFPVSNKLYWYFTAYTGLFALMPIINNGIRNMNSSTLKKMFVPLILLFSVFESLFVTFETKGGYSFVWILIVYTLGLIIKKCDIGKNIKPLKAFLYIIILNIITYAWNSYGLEINLTNILITKGLLISYTSPTILISAILYLIAFSKIKLSKIKKLISFFAPSAFIIYISNCHPMIWNNVMKDLFVPYIHTNPIKLVLMVLGFSILYSLVVLLIDKIRILIFKVLKIDKLTEKIELSIRKIISKRFKEN